MQVNNLLLAKSGHKKPERHHSGNVITLKPDMRWCSDGFEVRCWNDEVVRVVFSLDCCDREVISWSATTGDIKSVMVQDLLTESVEKRFGNTLYLPHAVEWLTDNGSCSCYSQRKETVRYATHLKVALFFFLLSLRISRLCN
ncbi:DDE-type integrase/transposase/recombinase (plasmid) [Pantoea dispersa]|nr:DDE-type integrase/transposase/recombinase [Pantoea dispersa]